MAALAVGGGGGRKEMEVFEVQTRGSVISAWRAPSKGTGFASKDGFECQNKEFITAPPGFEFDSGWQLDLANVDGAGGVGETDEDGGGYATDINRFGQGKGAHRIPRTQKIKDVVRRRRWVRGIRPRAEQRKGQTPEQKREVVRVLLDGLTKAQREVEKMGSRLGTKTDSEQVRETVRDYLGKIKIAQAEVRRQIQALDDGTVSGEGASQQGMRHLQRIEQPFAAIEDDIARKLRAPIAAAPRSAAQASSPAPRAGGAVSGGGPGSAVSGGGPGSAVSGGGPGKGRGGFVPGGDLGDDGGGDGAYVSRQQQEQLMAERLRAVGEEEVDLAIMQEREQHINQVRCGARE